MHTLVIVMGPAGIGKSTIAAGLAGLNDWPMIEADDYHPLPNKEKMATGTPLTDADRIIWLDRLISEIKLHASAPCLILACSALTPYVQTRLKTECERSCQWVLLTLEKNALKARLEARKGHFMPASQLDDQLKALTEPKAAIKVAADRPVHTICQEISNILNEKTD